MKKIATLTFEVVAEDFPSLGAPGEEDWVDRIEHAIFEEVPGASVMNQTVSGVDEEGNFFEPYIEVEHSAKILAELRELAERGAEFE